MITRNACMEKLAAGYLFPEINRRKKLFLESHPGADLISLGIGDTTEPLSSHIAEALSISSSDLATTQGFFGYGPEQGMELLREKISKEIYGGRIASEEIFVSDGAKCDIGRLQALFGSNISIAVQDPAYPVYIDGSLIHGVKSIHNMLCTPENGFFPDLSLLPHVDIIYFCSPNNPTGAVSTRAQLEELVAYARQSRTLIIFDSAYASYIQDPELPRSIFEIPGAHEVAIEIGSFSKLAGFTGVRLGWTVVPEALKYENGISIRSDWNRITTTLFNGASIIAQKGGIAALEEKGQKDIRKLIAFYLENASLMKTALEEMGYTVFGGIHAPYLWVHFPGKKSWDVFQELLETVALVTTPGAGFGPGGEGFIRLSAYGRRETIERALKRLRSC